MSDKTKCIPLSKEIMDDLQKKMRDKEKQFNNKLSAIDTLMDEARYLAEETDQYEQEMSLGKSGDMYNESSKLESVQEVFVQMFIMRLN